MREPNLVIVGDVHHIGDYDPHMDDIERVESLERVAVIQFPDHQSIKEFLKTGKIEECLIFGEKA